MLTGDLVILRKPLAEDINTLLEMRNDAELQSLLMADARPNDESAVRHWLDRRTTDANTLFFIITERSTDECAGFVQVVDIRPDHGHGRFGIAVHPRFRGRGFARESIALCEMYARESMNVRKIYLEVLSGNDAAIALYSRLQYREVGVLRNHFRSCGKWHDVTVMEKLLTTRAEGG